MKKRVLSMVLALTLCLTMLPTTAMANGAESEITWLAQEEYKSIQSVIEVEDTGEYYFLVENNKGMLGLVDERGEVILPCEYQSTPTYMFVNGLMQVKQNGKLGFIDTSGKIVIPCEYTSLIHFSETGPTVAKKNNKFGLINRNNEVVLPFEYDYLFPFSGNRWIVGQKGTSGYTYGLIDIDGNLIVPCMYYSIESSVDGIARIVEDNYWDGKYGYIDIDTGRVIAACQYDTAEDFSTIFEGLAMVGFEYYDEDLDWNVGKAGFIDKTGSAVIPIEFSYFREFSDEYVVAGRDTYTVNADGSAKSEEALIDRNGNFIIPFGKYDRIETLSEGLSVVESNGKYGCINAAGELVIPLKFDRMEDFSDGMALVAAGSWYDEKCGYIDKTGKLVIPYTYDSGWSFSNGITLVFRGDLFGYIDKTGKEILPCKYDYLWHRSQAEGNRWVEFKENGKYGHIDNNGKLIVILPGEYDSIDSFCEGLACVKKGEKYGFINADCRLVIPYEYDSAVSFRDGVAAVGNDGKKGLIDKSGNAVLPLQYDSILTPMNVTAPFFIIKDGSRLGILAQSDLSKYVTEPEPAPAPVEPAPQPPVSANTAYASTQNVEIDGKAVEVQAYALKDANGNPTNYVKLRDVAMLLNGSAAQFEVSWDGAVNIVTGESYTENGSEMKTPFSGDRSYTVPTAATKINGAAADLAAITLTDDAGGGYTYYQLRDLGRSLGFNVGWSAERGIYVETDKAYVG